MLKSTCQQIFKKIQHFDFFKELAIADGLFTGRNLQVVSTRDSLAAHLRAVSVAINAFHLSPALGR